MSFNLKTYFFLISTLISFLAYSQDDQSKEFIVTFEKDTIYGETSFKAFGGYNFKNVNGIKSVIKASEVYEFYFADGLWSDTYFESVILTEDDENRVFLVRLIDGKIKMFIKTIQGGEFSTVTYYLSKNNSKLIYTNIAQAFSRKKSHQQVRELISDNDEILMEFDTLKGKLTNIKYIIEKYNECSK